MLTLREVSCCLLSHSKMGIKELISDIKGFENTHVQMQKKTPHPADTPMVFCYCGTKSIVKKSFYVVVFFGTSLMIDLILIFYVISIASHVEVT